MGKGAGCVPSKQRATRTTPDAPPPHAPPSVHSTEPTPEAKSTTSQQREEEQEVVTKLKIFIVFYSMYGHVEALATRMKKGVDGVDGVEAVLYRVPETLSHDVLEQMRAPPKSDDIKVLCDAEEMVKADGVLFGFPTRYGCMAAQMKAFWDSTGELWKEQKLAGKPAGFFVSTGTQGGGQETTA